MFYGNYRLYSCVRHLGRHFEKMAQYFDMRLTPLKSGCDGLSDGISLVLIFQPVPKLDGGRWRPLLGTNVTILGQAAEG